MELIATHNSATCKRGTTLVSWLTTPFARCQSKSLAEQYDAGCRYFDLRVRQDEKHDGRFYVCHGVWRTSSLTEVLQELADAVGSEVFIDLTWEGDVSEWGEERKKAFVGAMHAAVNGVNTRYGGYNPLRLASVQGKSPYGTYFWRSEDIPNLVKGFRGLYWFTWRLLIPIPWFWRKVYGQAELREDVYTQVDFL